MPPKIKKQKFDRLNMPSINYIDPKTGLRKLSPNEACEKFSMLSWTNQVHHINPSDDAICANELQDIINLSIATQEKMAITTVEINGAVVFGLVAIEPIPKGSVLLYSSKVLDKSEIKKEDLYMVGLPKNTLSAKNHGNMSRFMNHALDSDAAKQEVKFEPSNLQDDMAVANFSTRKVTTSTSECFTLNAEHDIEVGEALYWNYSLSYFQHLEFPIVIFNKLGTVINANLYQWVNPVVQIQIGDKTVPTHANFKSLLSKNGFIILCGMLSKFDKDIVINAEYIREILSANPALANSYYITIPLPNVPHASIKYLAPSSSLDLSTTFVAFINRLTANDMLQRTIEKSEIKYELFTDRQAGNGPFDAQQKRFLVLQDSKILFKEGFSLEDIREKLTNLGIECIIDGKGANRLMYISQVDLYSKIDSQPPVVVFNNTSVTTFSLVGAGMKSSGGPASQIPDNEEPPTPTRLMIE
jgi:hypothetical protein